MTEDQAQRAVDSFSGTRAEAEAKAAELNQVLEVGPNGPMLAVTFDGKLWCVMLTRAYLTAKLLGI